MLLLIPGGMIVNTGGIEMNGGTAKNGYTSFVNAGGIDDEFLDTLFTTHVFDVSYEYIESDIELISLIFMRLMRLQI